MDWNGQHPQLGHKREWTDKLALGHVFWFYFGLGNDDNSQDLSRQTYLSLPLLNRRSLHLRDLLRKLSLGPSPRASL